MTPRQVALWRGLAAVLVGAVSVLGFAPFRIAIVPIAALAALFLLWRTAATARAAAGLGFAFGLGFFLTGTSWVYVSLHTFGGMPAWLTAISTFCFCAVVALYPTLAGWLAARLGRPQGRAGFDLLVVMPACWTAGEIGRGYLFTGFPWLGLGYSQVPDSPLAAFAPIAGSYGVTAVAAVVAGAIALAGVRIAGRQSRALFAPAIVVALAVGSGAALHRAEWTTPSGKPVTVALLQGNVPQERKFDVDVLPSIFAQYRTMVEKTDAQLVVLPETAFPVFLHQIRPDYLDALTKTAVARDGDILFGVAVADPEARAYFNAVVSTGASTAQAYRKSHLVPFGEFLPLRPLFEWVLDVLQIPMADFTAGSSAPPTIDIAGQRLALSICYEDAFGNEMLRQLPAATLLVNVSNDAWFGDSLAAEQHFQLAQMRALEAGRMMLRANNTGVTAIVGPRGETLARLPGFVEGTLAGVAQGRTGATPYIVVGDWGIIGVVAIMLSIGFVAARRGRSSRAETPATTDLPEEPT